MTDIDIVRPGPLARVAWAIRERMEMIFPPALFVHEWMPARVDAVVWAQLNRRPPMIGIGFGGFSRVETSSGLNVVSDWSIYVVTNNPRGRKELLFGDNLAPGQLPLAEAAAAAIHGYTVKDLTSFQVSSGANSFIEDVKAPDLSITAIELTARIDLSIGQVLAGAGVTPDDLLRQSIAWSFSGATVNDTIITNPGTP